MKILRKIFSKEIFSFNEIFLNLFVPFRFQVLQLEAEMLQRTYDQEVQLRLGGVQMRQLYEGQEIFMVNTPMSAGGDEYLIIMRYVNVNKRSPEFTTRHGSVVKLLRLEFTSLDTLLHQEALIELLRFGTYIQDSMNSLEDIQKKEIERSRPIRLTSIQEETSGFLKEQLQKQRLRPTGRRKKQTVEFIDLKVNAKIGSINLKISSTTRDITAFYIEGISASFLSKSSYLQVNADLTSVSIKDLNPVSMYKDIVTVEGTESLQVGAFIFILHFQLFL